MGRLVSEGYVLTVLAPNDEAMARLTTDQLSEPGSPENILYYHMVPEYQTEESIVQRRAEVRDRQVRHAAPAAEGHRQGGRRLRQVRARRGVSLPLRPGHLHRRADLRPGHRCRALPAWRRHGQERLHRSRAR
ncbi:hypothetical protein ACQ4PT_055364 [Festuca glaucescens]